MSGRLILATRNPGKLRELQALLVDLDVEVISLPGDAPEVEETADTFAGNAALKARAASFAARASAAPAWVLADDSGLEVDALGGAPGVLSARYAGVGASDAACVAKLLSELEGVPDEQRTARFRCALCLVGPDGREWQLEAAWEGRIAHAPRGENGFGYDPVFLLPANGVTSAELPPEEKNRLSHRGQALAQARAILLTELGRG